MSKKVLSVLVALCMMVSLFAVAANAAALIFEDESSTNEQVWSLTEPADNSDGTYSVDVVLTTNYGVGQIQFKLQTTGTVVIEDVVNNVDDIFRIGFNKETGNVALYANTTGLDQLDAPVYEGVSIVTVTVSGAGTLAIVDDPKTADNVGGTLIASRMDNGDIVNGDPVLGQAYSFDVQEVTIGEAADPVLIVRDGMNGYINRNFTSYQNIEEGGEGTACAGFIYGVEVTENGDTIDQYFDVVNGDMEIVPSYLAGGSDVGTGAIVNVLDDGGNVFESYVFILFGDINGDGEITADDGVQAALHEVGGYLYSPDGSGSICDNAMLLAGDVNGSGDVTADDFVLMSLHEVGGYTYGSNGATMTQADAIAIAESAGVL